MLRYTWNYGQNWSNWQAWEQESQIPKIKFAHDPIWNGDHIIVECECLMSDSTLLACSNVNHLDWSILASSASHVIHADYDYSGKARRVPQYLVRGSFNEWGYDKGINNVMALNDDGNWELEVDSGSLND
jgi:alpha-1,3-glucan synthase